MNFDPLQIETQLCYQLMTSSITPRPIAWISTLSAEGTLNLAPYSFFTVASCNPPVLLVTQVNPRTLKNKDTLTNLNATKQCVVNIVSTDNLDDMNASCADYPPDVSEFEAAGIASAPSARVKPDGVKAAKVRFECNLREIIQVSSLPSGGTMMLLEVVSIYVDEHVMQDHQIAPELIDTLGKLGGENYATTRDRLKLARPQL